MNDNEVYQHDYNNLPPDEKAAWTYERYHQTRSAIEKYFVSYGLDAAILIEIMERAKESDVRYQTMIDIIDNKVLPPNSRELNELQMMISILLDKVLLPLPPEFPEERTDRRIRYIGNY